LHGKRNVEKRGSDQTKLSLGDGVEIGKDIKITYLDNDL
jgi:hypothetical protein